MNNKLIFAFRNFKRNKMVNLSATSIRHFIPDAEIYSFTFYADSNDYLNQEPLQNIKEIFVQTKYVNTGDVLHDCIDSTKTSGYHNYDNGKYFTEGFNTIYQYFSDRDTPVVMLAEDHFFTTGKVLEELISNNYTVAYAPCEYALDANAALLTIVPIKVSHLFPLPEQRQAIEGLLREYLITQIEKDSLYAIQHRKWLDYCGDGIYTNSSEEMISELQKAGII